MAWDESFNGVDINADVRGTRVSSAGALLDGSGFTIGSAMNGQVDPAIAWNGTNYLVVWSDQRAQNNYQLYGTLVHPAGIVIEPAGLPINTTELYPERTPDVASDGTDYYIAWSHTQTSDRPWNLLGTRLRASDGALLDASPEPVVLKARTVLTP